MTTITWTHPSVVGLCETRGIEDPLRWVEVAARELALKAMDAGWSGPPYDAFELADALGIEVVARDDLDDARLVLLNGEPRIEFNPHRRAARVRFSIAHEVGHFLFDDYGQRTRYRDLDRRRDDDWQLEMLCNVAAAELIMPIGALPIREAEDLDLIRLLDERSRFGVSTEALLRRVVRLTGRPTCLFAAARVRGEVAFRVDYTVASRAWSAPVGTGDIVTESTVLGRCTAVGYADHGIEAWAGNDLSVQAVGIPPYPGDTFPRVVGLLAPPVDTTEQVSGIHYVRGDACEPPNDGPAIIAHVVNNQARRWGGRGFARALMNRYPVAHDAYAEWSPDHRRLGAVHVIEAAPNVWVASMVAQAGYGSTPTRQPRLRLPALTVALRELASRAAELGAGVHMPLIGTGQGGMAWPKVRDLIVEEVVDARVPVTVYVLPDAPMPEDATEDEQLTLL